MSINLEKQFERQKKQYLSDRKTVMKQLQTAQKAYDRLQRSNDPRKEIKLQYEKNKVSLYQYRLDLIEGKLKFLRLGNEEDASYRLRQYNDFADKVKPLIPQDLPLRFHGCPIDAAEKIIVSGEISSAADRTGIETSFNGTDQISVTTREDLSTTVREYTNLTANYNMPAGCIFVITPKNLDDEISANKQLMHNVNFKDTPDRLVAVISSPENIPELKSWLHQNGCSPQKAIDFDGFVHSIDKIIASVRIPYRNISGKTLSHSLEVNTQTSNKSRLDSLISGAKQRADTQTLSQNSLSKSSVDRKVR